MEEERCLNNWDLGAVVRLGCRRRLSPPPQQPDNPFAAFQFQFQPPPPTTPRKEKPAVPVKEPEADAAGWGFPDLCAGQDGDELIRALLAAQPPLPPPPPPLPTPPTQPPQPQQQQQLPPPVVAPVEAPPHVRAAPPSAPARAQPSGRPAPGGVPRSKRRKNQVKKVVCHVPADGSSSDVWAWRKYGQKPIKGSPYPRGYYRCSSSKGCAARKQVERSRADPNTFILTYTGEHNHAAPTHRNSLAGTTRHKFPSAAAQPQAPPPSVVVAGAGAGDLQQQHQHQHQQPSPSPTSTSTAGLSPTTPLRTPSMEEDDDEEEDELLVEDMEMAGEDELLFLGGDADAAGEPTMSSLFDAADEPFLSSPCWASAAGAPAATGAAGAGS